MELTREITFFQTVKYQNRHEGTEDLFLHHRIGKTYVVKDRRFNTPVSSGQSYLPGTTFLFIDQPKDPVKVFFVDDLSVIRIVQRPAAILFPDLFLHFFDQPVFYGTVAVNVIRGPHRSGRSLDISRKQSVWRQASDQRSYPRYRDFFPQVPG